MLNLLHLYILVQLRVMKVLFHILGNMALLYDLHIVIPFSTFLLMPTIQILYIRYGMLHMGHPYLPKILLYLSFLPIGEHMRIHFLYISLRIFLHHILLFVVFLKFLILFLFLVQLEVHVYPNQLFLILCNLSLLCILV